MLTKAQIKHLQGLKLKKYRQNYGDFVIEGDKLVTEALLENVVPDLLIATNDWMRAHAGSLPEELPVAEVTEQEMAKISSLSTPQPVLALVKKRVVQLKDVDTGSGWILVLDDIRDPGNFGTILRTADWFGFSTVVCSASCVELYNPKVIQSTMGAIFRSKVVYTDLVNWLPAVTLPKYAAVLGGNDLRQTPFTQHGVLVIGSESHGISDEVLRLCAHHITIPAHGKGESLNAGIAAGICMYHIRAGH